MGCTDQWGRPVQDGLREAAGKNPRLQVHFLLPFTISSCFLKLLPVNFVIHR